MELERGGGWNAGDVKTQSAPLELAGLKSRHNSEEGCGEKNQGG